MSHSKTNNPDVIDTDNVQGDILLGFPKKKEEFVFFVIKDAKKFKHALSHLKVTTTTDVMNIRKKIRENKAQGEHGLLCTSFLNIGFSRKGFDALKIKDDLGDALFSKGQLADAKELGDEGTDGPNGFEPSWDAAFKHRVDGVLFVAGESWSSVNTHVAKALFTFGDSIHVVHKLKGSVRPGAQKGHEHFGWMDGISNPAVKGVGNPLPGQRVVRPGVILCGKTFDPVQNRPEWATEGTFLAFREYDQLVPEFHKFLSDNPIPINGLDRKLGSELLGARMVGRWKSGAPLALAPTKDDPKLAKDPQRNNDFIYSQKPGDEGQELCPYAAHIRKTNPRNDLDFAETDPKNPVNAVEKSSIMRSGIPYGPEVTHSENEEHVTEFRRGLAFVCYQSAIDEGFHLIQKKWSNAPDFPPAKNVTTGFDPIIGQANGQSRQTLGTSSGSSVTLPRDFVLSRGGEYFFLPSIKALKTKFASASG